MVQQLSANSRWLGGSLSQKVCSSDWSQLSPPCGHQGVLSYTPLVDLPPSPNAHASITGQLQPVSFGGASQDVRHDVRYSSWKSGAEVEAEASCPHLLRPDTSARRVDAARKA